MIPVIERAEEAVLRRYHAAEERYSEGVEIQPAPEGPEQVDPEIHSRLIESIMVGVPG